MRKGNTKSAKGKRLAVTEADRVVVGLDVHKREIHAAVRVNGQEVGTHVLPAQPAAVEKFLAPYRPGLKHVVYEAGPTGYGLARHLRSAGVPVDVIAPSKTPQAPGDRSKSDRLDCLELARLDEANLLKAVGVPTEEEEAERQVIRLRDQAVADRRRVRQRIKSFLLMHGLAEPAGLEHWSAAGVAALGSMTVGNGRLRFCLDLLLEALANADETIEKVGHEMKEMAEEPRHAAAVQALTAHVGVGRTTALAFEMELFRPERFSNERQVSAMLGLAPRVRESGGRRQEGPLIKAGRGRLRALLVEAAWVWIRHDAEARKVYQRLVHNTGSTQKAIVGMARRLGLDLWRRLVKARAAA